MLGTGLQFYAHISDIEVKVTGFEILCLSFWLKFLEVYIFWSFRWILLILCLIIDTGLNFYAAPSPTPHYPWVQGHRLWNFALKFKVFRSGYLLNLKLDLVDTSPDLRYWSKILCCTIPMPPHPFTILEVKVTDRIFLFNEMFISHQSSHQKAFIFQIGSASIP